VSSPSKKLASSSEFSQTLASLASKALLKDECYPVLAMWTQASTSLSSDLQSFALINVLRSHSIQKLIRFHR